jgi:5-formyltetrahydrofolate cyclo-ligase
MGLESLLRLCEIRPPSLRTQAHLSHMPADLIASKADLRRAMREHLRTVSEASMMSTSERIHDHLITNALSGLRSGMAVALFGGIQGEPDLRSLVPWLKGRGVHPVFFAFTDDRLVPRIVDDAHSLTRGLFGVWMPDDRCPSLAFSELDYVLVPGLAFDRQGGRLGRGRGYFDRLFDSPGVRAQRLGVCLECQVVPAVPMEPHDARMHQLITEQGVIRIVQ